MNLLAQFAVNGIVAGSVYAAYATFIRHWDINRLPYDGAADRWFDPGWLVAGGHPL